MNVEQLRSPLRESLSGKREFEEMILDATNRRGRRIKCYLAITPLIAANIEWSVLIIAYIDKVNSMISAEGIAERRQKNS